MRTWQIALWAGLALGCAEESLPEGELLMSPGHELETWDEEPGPAEITVDRISRDGTRSAFKELPAAARRFTMGKGDAASFEVTAFDGTGAPIVNGRTMPLVPNGLAGYRLPLFVGRVDRFSRPPGELFTSQVQTEAVVMVGRHLLLFAQDVTGTVDPAGYDFGVWLPHAGSAPLACPELPCVFESVLAAGPFLAAISSRWGIWFDVIEGSSGNLPQDGLTSFAELAGGSAVPTPDGDAYLVGATRDGEPTTAVLHLKPDGAIDVLRLLTPRAGAAAAWVPERGLVVVGGSASGAGAELLAAGSQAFVALPLPVDATQGAGLAAIDGVSVFRAGGLLDGSAAPSVVLTLDCADCAPEPRGEPLALTRARAFGLGDDDFLVVGTDAEGATAALRVRAGEVTPRPLREPRRRAVALQSPTGQVMVAGGELLSGDGAALTLELFTP